MELDVALEVDADGVWVASVPALPGCYSQGASREDALRHIREAIQGHLEVLGELPPTIEMARVSVDA